MTEAAIERQASRSAPGWRALHVMRRNALVWRKLMIPSLIGNLAEPLIYLIGLGYGVGALIGEVDGRPYVTFLAAGMICYSTMNSASFEALYSAFARMQVQRTWEGMLHAPLTSDDIVTGEWLWAGMKALFSGTAILLVMYGFGIVQGAAPLAVLPVALLIGLAFAGIALVVTSFAKSYDFFTYYFVLLVTPMSFLSGIYFPLSQLPEAAQTAAWFLPLAHAASLARGLTLGDPMPWPLLSVAVLLGYGLVGLTIAKHRVRKRLSR